MRYRSTRGGVSGLSFEDVVLSGYASDGGMFMPEVIPVLSADELRDWSTLSYKQLVEKICSIYVGEEINSADLHEIIECAYSNFPHSEVIPCITLQPSGATLLEMFHGPTMAFKDLSMCCAVQLSQHFLKKNGRKAVILCATSGDTGSSALAAVKHTDNVNIIVLLPKNRISNIQERQMTSIVSPNCHIVRADGSSDDTDPPIKNLFCDKDFADKYNLSSLNSVNWARMMVQIAHHFYATFQAQKGKVSRRTVIYIPTGGLGNATAASIAVKMGLPAQIVCAVTNDALLRAVNDNDYSAAELNVSLATAMNIQVPYNWERVLYVFSDGDTEMIKRVLTQYESTSKAEISEGLLKKMRDSLSVELISDTEIIDTMKKCYRDNIEYVICPHTATALTAHYRATENSMNAAVLGVASPAKFTEAVDKAGLPEDKRLSSILNLPTRYVDWGKDEDWEMKLRQLIISICDE